MNWCEVYRKRSLLLPLNIAFVNYGLKSKRRMHLCFRVGLWLAYCYLVSTVYWFLCQTEASGFKTRHKHTVSKWDHQSVTSQWLHLCFTHSLCYRFTFGARLKWPLEKLYWCLLQLVSVFSPEGCCLPKIRPMKPFAPKPLVQYIQISKGC